MEVVNGRRGGRNGLNSCHTLTTGLFLFYRSIAETSTLKKKACGEENNGFTRGLNNEVYKAFLPNTFPLLSPHDTTCCTNRFGLTLEGAEPSVSYMLVYYIQVWPIKSPQIPVVVLVFLLLSLKDTTVSLSLVVLHSDRGPSL